MSHPGILQLFAGFIGTTEPAVRLILSLFVGYPVALFHRRLLQHRPACIQHLSFALAGFWLGYFNFGWDVGHSVVCVLLQWLLLRVLRGTMHAVIVSFVFQMIYLIIGYVVSQTEQYDINWSTPHCLLALRLIGVAFDTYDGHKNEKYLSAEQSVSALSRVPSLLEMCGHALFPATYMVGPLFSMRRYLAFTSGSLVPPAPSPPTHSADQNTRCDVSDGVTAVVACDSSPVRPAMKRLAQGFMYLLLHQLLYTLLVPDHYFGSEQFLESRLWSKMLWIGVWVKVVFMRYLAAWLFSEGGCILTGLTYNGRDSEGAIRWDALANVDIGRYENATRFQVFPSAFNVNTNNWVSKYIFKRLRFLGSKELSQFITLLFLAVWHGYHLGYFIVFGMEFMIIVWERKIEAELREYPSLVDLLSGDRTSPVVRWPLLLLLRMYTCIFLGYSCVPFVCVVRRRWWPVMCSVYWCGHVFFLSWPLLVPLLRALLPLVATKHAANDGVKHKQH